MDETDQNKTRAAQLSPQAQDRKTDLVSGLWLAFFLVAFLLVDIASLNTEFLREGRKTPWSQIVLMETSGVFAFICSIPFIAFAAGRVPPGYTDWRIALPLHFGFSLITAVIILALMVSIRKLLSPAILGEAYFFSDSWSQEFFYEYRKIVLFYALALFFMVLGRQIAASERALEAAIEDAGKSQKISLRSGGRMVSLNAASIIRIKAEANYLEITSQDGTHFIRGTLSHLIRILDSSDIRFLQVHRSHVINADCIRETRPDGQGGLKISLLDGSTVPGSRTFRKQVEQDLTQ